MQIIIDANIVMAMLIKPGKPIDLFFNEELDIFAPSFLLEELDRNKDIICAKSGLDEPDVVGLLDILIKNISFVPAEDFLKLRDRAGEICPDPKDVTYFALALHLKCPIWTNEKKLKEQLKIKIYATHELMELFGIS